MKLIVGTVGVQIFNMKRKPLTTLQIRNMPEWSVGKTVSPSGAVQHWVRLFTGKIFPSLMEKKLTGVAHRLPDKKDLYRHQLDMGPKETLEFCATLEQVNQSNTRTHHNIGKSQSCMVVSSNEAELRHPGAALPRRRLRAARPQQLETGGPRGGGGR